MDRRKKLVVKAFNTQLKQTQRGWVEAQDQQQYCFVCFLLMIQFKSRGIVLERVLTLTKT